MVVLVLVLGVPGVLGTPGYDSCSISLFPYPFRAAAAAPIYKNVVDNRRRPYALNQQGNEPEILALTGKKTPKKKFLKI